MRFYVREIQTNGQNDDDEGKRSAMVSLRLGCGYYQLGKGYHTVEITLIDFIMQ